MNEFESEILRQATTSKQSAALVLLLLAMCEWMGWAVGCYCSYTMCWCSLKYCIYCYVLCCELYQNAIITPFFSTSCTINGSQFRRAEVYINLGLENHWPEINAQTSEIGHSWKVLYFFSFFHSSWDLIICFPIIENRWKVFIWVLVNIVPERHYIRFFSKVLGPFLLLRY